jgi:dihydrofolate reductase
MDKTEKFVASKTLKDPLSWSNSTLLKGDAGEAVAKLKKNLDRDLVVLGSGELLQSLMRSNLVDKYVLMIHPLLLGSGRRMFSDGGLFATLKLIDSKTTTTGVVIATYEPVSGDR